MVFTANLQRHVVSPTVEVPGATVREALDRVFAAPPALRSTQLPSAPAAAADRAAALRGPREVGGQVLDQRARDQG